MSGVFEGRFVYVGEIYTEKVYQQERRDLRVS